MCPCLCVYAYWLCMREQPSLFIMMSPVMAAKLTMCFRERSWLDKSLCGRRCVLSTPNHLYCDLSQVEDPPLTGTRKYVLNGWLVDQLQAEPKRKQNFLVQLKKEDDPSPKSHATSANESHRRTPINGTLQGFQFSLEHRGSLTKESKA